jgi:Ulp1 protease family, C-terminal catalytic domain
VGSSKSNGNIYSYSNPLVWKILPEELVCLKPGCWLNDLVINGIFYKYREKNPSCMLLTTHFFYEGGIATEYWYPRENWSKFQWIIIPLHMNNNHWAVVFLHRGTKNLYLCDPFRTAWNTGAYSVVFSVLVKYFADRFGCPGDTFYGVSCKMPRQKNGYDCGVYVLRYVEEFLQNPIWFQVEWDKDRDFIPYPNEWASEFREKVRKSLCSTTTSQSPVEVFSSYFDFENYPTAKTDDVAIEDSVDDPAEIAFDMSGKGIYYVMLVHEPPGAATPSPKEDEGDPLEEIGLGVQTQQSTQYSYDDYSNSQLLLVSDVLDQPITNTPADIVDPEATDLFQADDIKSLPMNIAEPQLIRAEQPLPPAPGELTGIDGIMPD